MSDGKRSAARHAGKATAFPAAIIAGFDVHLRQITFDCLDSVSGEVLRGPLRKATPDRSSVETSTLRRNGDAAPPKYGSKKYFAASFQVIHASVSPPHSV